MTLNAYKNYIDVFGYEVQLYSLFVIGGFLMAFIICNHYWKKARYRRSELDNFFFGSVIFAILGARLWYAIANPGVITFGIGNSPDMLISFNMAGLAIQGGVIAVFIFGLVYFSKPGRSATFIQASDIIVPTILIGHMIGRWGNFFNQEVYGASISASQLGWVPSFVADNMMIDGSYRIPLFLIEGVLNVIAFFVIVFIIKKITRGLSGVTTAAYFIYYGILRAVLENFRDQQDIMYWGSIRSSIVMSFVFIAIGTFILYYYSWPSYKLRKQGIV